jgi:two-component system, cell cycle response regulator CpdR
LPRVVLVVDDEPLIIGFTASILENLGCEVVTAANAREAVEKLSIDRRIEILITDINMPCMSGCELTEKAKRLRQELQVILLSGGETNSRGYPLVRKPFVQQDLVRVMERTTGLC